MLKIIIRVFLHFYIPKTGGPLMLYTVENEIPYWALLGAVSFGPKQCGLADVPGVYTRISSFLEWISDNIRE